MALTAEQARKMTDDVSFRADVSSLREYVDADIKRAARGGRSKLEFIAIDYVHKLCSLKTPYEREHWCEVVNQLTSDLDEDGYIIDIRPPYFAFARKYSISW